MKALKIVGLLLTASVIFCSCSTTEAAIPNKQEQLIQVEKPKINKEDSIYTASNTLGIQLVQKINEDGSENNLILSPFSLSVALATLQNGATGKTKAEIAKIINPSGLSAEELNEKYCNTINQLMKTGYEENGGKTTIIEIADSLWVMKELPIKENFLNISNSYFGTEVFNINFDNKDKRAMNQWIEEKTHGKIKDYIKDFDTNTVIEIFNSIYFNGKWQNTFDKSKTQKEEFSLKNGTTIAVDMMNADKWMDYYEDDKVKAGVLNYYGCNMLVLLPKGEVDAYINQMDYAEIKRIRENMDNMKVKVKFPKFSFNQKNKLTDYLKALGMEASFDSIAASFTNIADSTKNFKLFISDVSQECFVSVDEEGTEAAALTSVTLCGAGKPKDNIPPELYLDKPFIFLITDERTGLDLFIGKVENPVEVK